MFKLIANIKNIIMPIKYNDFLFGFFIYICIYMVCLGSKRLQRMLL